MAEIARWTTPFVTYKPSMVEISEVDEIFLIIEQDGHEDLIVKDKTEATVDAEEGFAWTLTQQESARLNTSIAAVVRIDYTDVDGNRYTTNPKYFEVGNSGLDREI